MVAVDGPPILAQQTFQTAKEGHQMRSLTNRAHDTFFRAMSTRYATTFLPTPPTLSRESQPENATKA